MNRRNFAKTSVGGLLALLLPAKVLAGPKPKEDERLWLVQGLTNDKLRLYGPVSPGLQHIWVRWDSSTMNSRYAAVGSLISMDEAAALAALWGVTIRIAPPIPEHERVWSKTPQYPLGAECAAPDGQKWRYVKSASKESLTT